MHFFGRLKRRRAERMVLWTMSAAPEYPVYVYDLIEWTGLRAKDIYPALVRLRAQDCVETGFEPEAVGVLGGVQRRWYRITSRGVQRARYLRLENQ